MGICVLIGSLIHLKIGLKNADPLMEFYAALWFTVGTIQLLMAKYSKKPW